MFTKGEEHGFPGVVQETWQEVRFTVRRCDTHGEQTRKDDKRMLFFKANYLPVIGTDSAYETQAILPANFIITEIGLWQARDKMGKLFVGGYTLKSDGSLNQYTLIQYFNYSLPTSILSQPSWDYCEQRIDVPQNVGSHIPNVATGMGFNSFENNVIPVKSILSKIQSHYKQS